MSSRVYLPRKWLSRGSTYLALLVLAIPFLFPFWWMFTSAFKNQVEIFEFPPPLLPHLQRLHHGAAQRPGFGLLPAGHALQEVRRDGATDRGQEGRPSGLSRESP